MRSTASLTRSAGSGRPSSGRLGETARPGSDGHLVGRWVPFALLTAIWAVMFPGLRHAGGPDGTAYISIAERWSAGDVSSAVNAYWGPLLSWLVAPLLALGVPDLVALRIVLLAGALAALVPLRSLARACGASAAATDAALLGVAPFLAYAAVVVLAPDVLLAAALLSVCAVLARPDLTTSRRTAVLVGVLGGVAYLAKAYALPVALMVVVLGALSHRLAPVRAPWRRVVGHGAIAVGALVVVVGAWAGLLSASYGAPTLTTAVGYNAALAAPDSTGNPFWWPGLYEPSDEDSVSAWEEPSRLPVATSGGAESEAASATSAAAGPTAGGNPWVAHRLANIRTVAAAVVWRAAPLAILALVGVGWHVLGRRSAPPGMSVSVLLAGINAAGLIAFVADERYTWVSVLALVPVAAVGIDVVSRRRRPAVVGVVALVLVGAALAAYAVSPRWNAHREVAAAAGELVSDGTLEGADVAALGSWHETLLLCAEAGCRYHGFPTAGRADGVAVELGGAGVTHLVVWRIDAGKLEGLPEPDPATDLAIYRVVGDALVLDREVRVEG